MPMKPVQTKADQLKRKEIALIQMGRAFVGQDDDTYRAMLAGKCNGKTSSTQLTWQERKLVIDHYKACGFVVKTTKASARTWDDGVYKLRAMWYALAEVQAVTKPETSEQLDAAIEAWAKRQLAGPAAVSLRMVSSAQMSKLIESMKRWCKRVGAPTQSEQAIPEAKA
jgi:phage gp16-like protein